MNMLVFWGKNALMRMALIDFYTLLFEHLRKMDNLPILQTTTYNDDGMGTRCLPPKFSVEAPFLSCR